MNKTHDSRGAIWMVGSKKLGWFNRWQVLSLIKRITTKNHQSRNGISKRWFERGFSLCTYNLKIMFKMCNALSDNKSLPMLVWSIGNSPTVDHKFFNGHNVCISCCYFSPRRRNPRTVSLRFAFGIPKHVIRAVNISLTSGMPPKPHLTLTW